MKNLLCNSEKKFVFFKISHVSHILIVRFLGVCRIKKSCLQSWYIFDFCFRLSLSFFFIFFFFHYRRHRCFTRHHNNYTSYVHCNNVTDFLCALAFEYFY
jgi:hypothetical protein